MSRLFISLIALAMCAGNAAAQDFRFITLGDMPYGDPKRVYPPFETLIGKINRLKPDFTIHVGDTKSSSTPCTDKALDDQLDFMNKFDGPLVYSPGDNEWTDCYRKKAGEFDPVERLNYIRKKYFPTAKSLGRAPMTIERQADVMKGFETYVENARFNKNGIAFITAHIVGSNNNFESHDPAAVAEFFDREKATLAWLKYTFEKAKDDKAKAIVLAIHANMFEFAFNKFKRERFLRHSGFRRIGKELIDQARSFGKPVLLIYGDSHIFRVYRPLRRRAKNITALEVYGASNMHAVEVTVSPDRAFPFAFRPVVNPDVPMVTR